MIIKKIVGYSKSADFLKPAMINNSKNLKTQKLKPS